MCSSALPEKAVEEVVVPEKDQLSATGFFPSMVYTIEKTNFLEDVKAVTNEAFKKIEEANPELHPVFPVRITGNLWEDPRMQPFCEYVASTAWNILDNQGYNMRLFQTTFSELWGQEHHKYSLMEQHVHGGGVHLVGFYFLETPEGCAKPVIHDPRIGKVQINLPEKDMAQVSLVSNQVYFDPKPGLLLFAPSWLQHSFSRHESDLPSKFLHFNIVVIPNPPAINGETACTIPSAAEVI
jgi:hypothetical protein